MGTKRGVAGAYLVGVPLTGLPVPLPDVLRLTPCIPFGQGGGVVQVGVSMGHAMSAPVVTGRIDPKNEKLWLVNLQK